MRINCKVCEGERKCGENIIKCSPLGAKATVWPAGSSTNSAFSMVARPSCDPTILVTGTGSPASDTGRSAARLVATTAPREFIATTEPLRVPAPRTPRWTSESSLFWVFGAGLGAAIGLALALSSLPDVSSLEGYVPFETSKIYDAKGQLVANLHGEENRVVVPLGEIPKHLQQAIFIAGQIKTFPKVRDFMAMTVNDKGSGRVMLKSRCRRRCDAP